MFFMWKENGNDCNSYWQMYFQQCSVVQLDIDVHKYLDLISVFQNINGDSQVIISVPMI